MAPGDRPDAFRDMVTTGFGKDPERITTFIKVRPSLPPCLPTLSMCRGSLRLCLVYAYVCVCVTIITPRPLNNPPIISYS